MPHGLWVVGLTNAFNFLDNMDGLAAGVGLIAAVLFAGGTGCRSGSLFVPAVLLVLVGALGGFLVHNHTRPGCSWGTPAATSSGSCSAR